MNTMISIVRAFLTSGASPRAFRLSIEYVNMAKVQRHPRIAAMNSSFAWLPLAWGELPVAGMVMVMVFTPY